MVNHDIEAPNLSVTCHRDKKLVGVGQIPYFMFVAIDGAVSGPALGRYYDFDVCHFHTIRF